jgi:sugar lactone lactonase YvrE
MPRSTAPLLAAIALGSAGLVHAALPTFWQVATEADFLRGDVENLSIDSFGRLTLGPTATPVHESTAPFLWTGVAAPDGAVYVGSGNEGHVYRIDPAGRSTVFFDAEELEVHALALAPAGALYAGTSPDGKVYRVEPGGKAAVFFDPPDKYIWSLAVDERGDVLVATGDRGRIYRIPPGGTGALLYDTKATHVMSLAFDRDRRLLAATASPARVFRLDAAGRPFVLLDSSYNEIRTLRVDPAGNVYAAAVGARSASPSAPAPAPPEPTPTPVVTAEVTAIVIADASVAAAAAAPSTPQTPAPRAPAGSAAGAVIRIAPDGVWDLLWESREDVPYDVAFESNGNLLVATGAQGKLYRLSGDPHRPTLVVRAAAQQVTSLIADRQGTVLMATSNPGKLLRLSATTATRGVYTSEVRDAQAVASWGTIKWRALTTGGSRIEISTRSGNTRPPDETWSDWSPPYGDPSGTPITSPRARYLQWRAVITAGRGELPELTSVTAAYLPRNARPRVTSITVHPPGTVFQRPFPTDPEIAGLEGDPPDRRTLAAQQGGTPPVTPPLGRRAYQKGLLTFIWRAEDDDRDQLIFEVLYRREGETTWKPLRRGMTDSILVWDTTSVPNGRYVTRVVASDAPSNSPATALTGALESAAFDIDNVPPEVTVTSVRRSASRAVIAFDVGDEHSVVQKVEYSLDGDRWVALFPLDGIADSRLEQFELVLEGSDAERAVILRASDAVGNVANARGDSPVSGRR